MQESAAPPTLPTYTLNGPYARAFDATRIFAALSRPEGLQWVTELRGNVEHVPVLSHISCNAHYTLFLPWILQELLKAIGMPSLNIGGPESCCGTMHRYLGDVELEVEATRKAALGFRRARPQSVVSVCPDCDETFNARPLENETYRYINFSQLLVEQLDALRPLFKPVQRRVVMHTHSANALRRSDAANIHQILNAVPGIQILPSAFGEGVGSHCHVRGPMPVENSDAMFGEARALGADTLVVPYHSCYRQHCGALPEAGIDVQHPLGVLAQALGIEYEEPYKALRQAASLDAACALLRPKAQALGLTDEAVREVIRGNVRS